jgi:hypothetical protein
MKRAILVVMLTCLMLGATQLAAEASATKCDFSGWSGCFKVTGSGLNVTKVESEFWGVENSYYFVYIRHRLCIDRPAPYTDNCMISPTFYVSYYDNTLETSSYVFPAAGKYPNGTVMCGYIYQSNSTGGNLVKRVGPQCATIHS